MQLKIEMDVLCRLHKHIEMIKPVKISFCQRIFPIFFLFRCISSAVPLS